MKEEGKAAVARLEMSMQVEREGRRFYLEAAQKTEEAAGKALWQYLARQEALHIDYLMDERRSLVDKGKWASVGMEGLKLLLELKIPSIFPKTAEAIGPDTDQLRALQTGIEMEIKSRDLYQDLREKTEDPQGKALYEGLAQWEEGHRRLLQAEHDYLTNTGSWFDIEGLTQGL